MNKKILVNFIGKRGAGPIYALEMTKGLLKNGAIVYAIISKEIENIDDWKKLDLKKKKLPTKSPKQ
jgi:hypothetical protein